jgi:hypothetical protein
MIDKIVPPALRIWLAFIFIFLLLGYEVTPSIAFGAIAGFAGGTIQAWWITPGGVPTRTDLPEPIKKFSRQIRATPGRLPFMKGFASTDRSYTRSKR